MATDVFTLDEFADHVQHLADEWDGPEAAVLVGDLAADTLEVKAKDGYTQVGSVGFASELFEDNGVWTLGEHTDRRFFGTVLIRQDKLSDDSQASLQEFDDAE